MTNSTVPQIPTITILPSLRPSPSPPEHHVGNPPASFRNPWPSFSGDHGLLSALQARFSPSRNFVPIPSTRDELVRVRRPDWGAGKYGMKATWFGHSSWLIEMTAAAGAPRGIRILLDPVFSERMSPVNFAGPKRFSPLPCRREYVPEVDLVAISHNHYDHLDAETIRWMRERGKGRVRFLCPLGVKRNLVAVGVPETEVMELDWWDVVVVNVEGAGAVRTVCTPAQHFSGRTAWDAGKALWCSWVLEGVDTGGGSGKKLFFAGDTGYRTVPHGTPASEEDGLPHCPAFAEVGKLLGPFDLALLPIGCYLPRCFMSHIHCAPEDSACIHQDIESKKSIGMHYGTIRGGISQFYEDVRAPAERWKKVCEEKGLKWGEEVGLCDIGETVVV